MLHPTLPALPVRAVHSSAVVWIDEGGAMLAATTASGDAELWSIPPMPADRLNHGHYLSRVVDEIGDRERLVILGRGWRRTELERAYVSCYGRGDRLVDVEPADLVERPELLERLRCLAG